MILISEFMDEGAVALLRQHHEVVHETDLPDRTEALGELIPAARALIVRNRTQVTADLLELATNLECVGRLGVGLDNIDLDACGKRGIAVFPASGANDRSVAEYVVASSMILLRGAFLSTAAVMDGKWPRQDCAGLEMEGRAIGLVGFGSYRPTGSQAERSDGNEGARQRPVPRNWRPCLAAGGTAGTSGPAGRG